MSFQGEKNNFDQMSVQDFPLQLNISFICRDYFDFIIIHFTTLSIF